MGGGGVDGKEKRRGNGCGMLLKVSDIVSAVLIYKIFGFIYSTVEQQYTYHSSQYSISINLQPKFPIFEIPL
jgi:hypothetical protein